jgi:hypothetical protein
LARDTRWAAVGNLFMSSPTSAMMICAACAEMPGISASRATAGMTGSPVPWPTRGPVVPSELTRCAAGISVISSSIRAVSASIWAVRESIWASRIAASSPWWSSNRPVSASTSAARLAFGQLIGQL